MPGVVDTAMQSHLRSQEHGSTVELGLVVPKKQTRLGYHAKGDTGLVVPFFIDIYRIHILGLDFQL